MKKNKKIIWGLGFLLAAVLLIVGSFYNIRVLDILIMLVMIILLIEGILHRNFILLLLPMAVILIINSDRLGITRISPWAVGAAALLGGIGLNVLFPRRRKDWKRHESISGINGNDSARDKQHGRETEEIVQTDSEKEVHLENSFGATVKYLTGVLPGQVRLESSFGSMSIYFDNAALKDHTASVHAETAFGNIVLYIPSAWNVVIKGESAFGNIVEKGRCNPDSEDTLEIRAEASFGQVEIRYI